MQYRIFDFISFINDGETPDSPYQSVIETPETFKKENPDIKEEDFEDEYLRMIEAVIYTDFCIVFIGSIASEIRIFLDYHYNKYIKRNLEGGDDFYYFLIDIMTRPEKIDPDFVIHKSNEIIINEWIKNKRNELTAEKPQTTPTKTDKAMDVIETWKSEYELRQFIDIAVRWQIEGIYKSRTKDNPWSVFDFYVENARNNFDLFCFQLNEKLTKNQNWKAIEIDLKHRFLPMINLYKEWYNKNKAETEKFDPYNPYKLMLSVIESTQNEILKYFPETLPTQQSERKGDPPAPDQEPTYNTLLDAFKDVSEYKRVMAILQSEGYITVNDIWQDHKKGWMTIIVSIIKLFAVKGYCKKTKFSPAEIQEICINTFQTETIGISTIKHASPYDNNINFD